ncbi:outer membrane protein assembly factor BamE [Rosenbergiella australiborealis]|uniref:Outer membrane protein assembly factor BamE n=2 Tax=Rosenbergiella australiborealis TaxID=1544696 RepID=A0ABS5TAD4_9GAMM|nr:OmpA family protein [Rosenbergiella australiborealis]MBT0727918.1 outer membrane protein assembly factor BamE [Rosenbergiella australiborealis]
MMINRFKNLLLIAMTTLVGCTSYGPDGFPKIEDSYLSQVIKYEPEQVAHVTVGTNKDAVRVALGNPQFNEFISNNWNYVLDIHNLNTNSYNRCQLKITFKNDIAQKLSWKGKQCPNDRVNNIKTASVLFGFAKYRATDIDPSSQRQLTALVNQMKSSSINIEHITLVGNADTVGQTLPNYTLGLERAKTVQQLLATQLGLAPGQFTLKSDSDLDAVQQQCITQSDDSMPCAQNFRRVDIYIKSQ